MAERNNEPPRERIWHWMRQNDDAAFAIVMAGIAALFIIGIVSAFNYAASDGAEVSLARPPAVIAGRMPVETTGVGGGGGERPRPPRHDPREDEQMERVR